MDAIRQFLRDGARALAVSTVLVGASASAAPPDARVGLPDVGEAAVAWEAVAALRLRGSGMEWQPQSARRTTFGLYAGDLPQWARGQRPPAGVLPGDEDAAYGLYVVTRF